METPLADKFIDNLNEQARKHSIASIYLGVFAVAGRTNLQEDLTNLKNLYEGNDDYFKDAGKENWFVIWHKSIRQTDYFSGCYTDRHYPLITDAERSEYRKLCWTVRQDDFDKRAGAVDGRVFNDTYRRYLDLNSVITREDKRVSIDGYLDSILWNTIFIDNDSILYQTLKKTFDTLDGN